MEQVSSSHSTLHRFLSFVFKDHPDGEIDFSQFQGARMQIIAFVYKCSPQNTVVDCFEEKVSAGGLAAESTVTCAAIRLAEAMDRSTNSIEPQPLELSSRVIRHVNVFVAYKSKAVTSYLQLKPFKVSR